MELRIARYFIVGSRLSPDCEVYDGINIYTGQDVVIKLESQIGRHHTLHYKFGIYKPLLELRKLLNN